MTSPTAPEPRRSPWFIYPVAVLYPLLFTSISLSWFTRQMAGWDYTGLLQGDQRIYTAWAREVFERGNGLVYANPLDISPDAPRVFSNFGYLLLAWTEKALPGGWVAAWEFLRILGGTAMALLLYHLLKRAGLNRRMTVFLWLLALTGGGIAWLIALPEAMSGQWLQQFMFIEDGAGGGPGYGWWLPNISRQPLYPLETLYHSLLYGTALAFLSRRPVLSLPLLGLLWWAHPITAALGTSIVGLAILEELAADRHWRRWIPLLAGLAAVGFCGAAYHRLFLPSHPSIRSLMEQTLDLAGETLKPRWWIECWGFFLLAAIGAVCLRPTRLFMRNSPFGRFSLCWIAAVLFWTHNNWFLAQPIQPMHFTRGHMLLGFIFLITAAIHSHENWLQRLNKRKLAFVAALAIVLGSMDNVLFAARMALIPPPPYHLTIHSSQAQVLEFLDRLPPGQRIHCMDTSMALHIASRTPHLVFMGDRAVTPFFDEKHALTQAFFANGEATLLSRYPIDYFIITRVLLRDQPMAAGLRFLTLVMENEMFLVMRTKQPL